MHTVEMSVPSLMRVKGNATGLASLAALLKETLQFYVPQLIQYALHQFASFVSLVSTLQGYLVSIYYMDRDMSYSLNFISINPCLQNDQELIDNMT